MQYIRCLDKTKYFIDPYKNKIYVTKGKRHKGLAYKILKDINLIFLYLEYKDRISAPEFLTYCGYVWVDEAQEDYILTFEDCKTVKYTEVAYCSKAIDKDYENYIKDTYSGEKNEILDFYEDIRRKDKIDELVEKIETIKKQIKDMETEDIEDVR